MTLQIRSLAEYKNAYQKSVDQPETFWEEQANTFVWRKKWQRCWDEVRYCSVRCKSDARKSSIKSPDL